MKISKQFQTKLILFIVYSFIYFPILFFVVSNDTAIYLQGGKTILDGGKLYIDFVDIKSPIFFTFYALINFISQNNILLFNIVCFIIYIFTSFLIFHYVKKFINETSGIIASIIYAVSVVCLNMGSTVHIETLFSSLLIFSMVFYLKSIEQPAISIFSKKSSSLIIHSIILSLLFSLKYTYIFIYFAYILFDFLSAKFTFKEVVKRNFQIFALFIISTIVFHFWLFDKQILIGYGYVFKFMAFYGSIPPLDMNLLRDIIKNIGTFFGDFYSLLFTFLAFYGIIHYLLFREDKRNYFIELTIVLSAFLLLSVISERKLLPYHFARMYILSSTLIGYGSWELFGLIFKLYKEKKLDNFKKFSIVTIFVFLLVTSEFSRLINIWKIPIIRMKSEAALLKMMDESRPGGYFAYYEKYKIADYMNQRYSPQTKVLIVSIGEFDLIYRLKQQVLKALPQRSNIVSKLIIPDHFNLFLKELNAADVLIAKKDDVFYFLTGNYLTSYQSLEQNPIISKILNADFHIIYEDDVNVIFERNK
jgi:hypothetical protein